ncbi:hypothetical protein ACTFIW_004377 [Dictyostelium discoideum]
MFIKLIFKFLLIILLISFIDCSNQLIYSISSNLNPTVGQVIYVINPINNEILSNSTAILDCSINGIVSIDENQMTAKVLCGYKSLISIDIKSGEFQILSTSDSIIPTFTTKTQQLFYNNNNNNNNIYMSVSTNKYKSITFFDYNFNTNFTNINSLPTYDYNYLIDDTSIYSFDYSSNKMYILYSSESNPNNCNLLSFNVNNIQNSLETFKSINNLENAYSQLLFTNDQSELFLLYGNPETDTFDICQFSFQENNNACENVLSIPVTQPYPNFNFLLSYLNDENQHFTIVLLSGDNESVQFTTYFISNFTVAYQYTLNNIWDNGNTQQTTYFYSF